MFRNSDEMTDFCNSEKLDENWRNLTVLSPCFCLTFSRRREDVKLIKIGSSPFFILMKVGGITHRRFIFASRVMEMCWMGTAERMTR